MRRVDAGAVSKISGRVAARAVTVYPTVVQGDNVCRRIKPVPTIAHKLALVCSTTRMELYSCPVTQTVYTAKRNAPVSPNGTVETAL